MDTTAIENELEGASLFFPTTSTSTNRTILAKAEKETGFKQESKLSQKSADNNMTPPPPISQKSIEEPQTPKGANTDTVSADTMPPSNHDIMVSRHHDGAASSTVEPIRKAVKLVGKEAATHRFTPEEKQAIADIIYTYRREGYDTNENEITRIAVNWLLWEHQESGQKSILARVLRALKQ